MSKKNTFNFYELKDKTKKRIIRIVLARSGKQAKNLFITPEEHKNVIAIKCK